MPIINYQGRALDILVKEKLIEKFTEIAAETTGIPRTSFTVVIGEYPSENVGVGGVPLSKKYPSDSGTRSRDEESPVPLKRSLEAGTDQEDRYHRGWEKLKEVNPEAGPRAIDSLKDIAPDFARLMIEFSFGDIFSRPGIDLKSREIAVVAALTALGNAAPQLKVHIHAALHVGCSRQEVVEILMQMALYAGFPAALNALHAAKEVFKERDDSGKD